MISICGEFLEGTRTMLEQPLRSPKAKVKAKLTGTLEGDI